MIEIRKSADRGYADHGWLKSHFSFSFAEYRDAVHMGFGPLRVINDDRIAAGMGFGKHGHRDMEIITYVLNGALAHEDSMGNGSAIKPGDVQRMSAGTGVTHSEFNHSKTGATHLLQIWITPNVTGIQPSYEEKHFDAHSKRGQLRLIASPDGRDGSVVIHQNASIHAGLFDAKEAATLPIAEGRLCYVHVALGRAMVNGQLLDAGDAAKMTGVREVNIAKGENAEVLVFDLPAE